MAIIFTNIQKEITLVSAYEGFGLEIVKGKEKSILNSNNEDLYLDLVSFANAMEMDINELMELISYNAVIKGYLAFYRDKNYKVIKVLSIDGIIDFIRCLRGLGYYLTLLKAIHHQVNKALEQIKEKE
jgi:hypothetical protein